MVERAERDLTPCQGWRWGWRRSTVGWEKGVENRPDGPDVFDEEAVQVESAAGVGVQHVIDLTKARRLDEVDPGDLNWSGP